MDDKFVLDGGGKNYHEGNLGNYPNDIFDDKLYNAHYELLKFEVQGEWIHWCILTAYESLEDGEEIFVRYGKEHWLYLPTFNTLPQDMKEKCIEYYKINDDEFWECIIETQIPGSSHDGTAADKRRTAATKTKQTKAAAAATKKSAKK